MLPQVQGRLLVVRRYDVTKEDGLFGDPLGVPLVQNKVYRLYIQPGAIADRYGNLFAGRPGGWDWESGYDTVELEVDFGC